MPRPGNRPHAAAALMLLAAQIALAGCDGGAASSGRSAAAATTPVTPSSSGSPCPGPPPAADAAPPAVGLMSSLPLTWPIHADMQAILGGADPMTWQRLAIGYCYTPVPLDTLSPSDGSAPEDIAKGPLAELDRLAIIQPRGLSPADNVALDAWVRGGGRLLLALDPALTGEYDLPLGDPRRPVDAALIPPVVARWGLAVRFDEGQAAAVEERTLGQAALPLALAGEVTIVDPAAAQCTLLAGGAAARCRVGAGTVTLIADAALFEHPELAGEGGARLRDVIVESVQ